MQNPEQLGHVPEEYRGETAGQDKVPEHEERPVDRKKNLEELEHEQSPYKQYEQLRQEGWNPEYPTKGIPERSRPSFLRTLILNGLRRAGNEVRVTPFYNAKGELVKDKLQIWTRLETKDKPEMGS